MSIGLGIGLEYVGYSTGSAGVGTQPSVLANAIIGMSGDDSYTTVGAGDHVDTGATNPTNLATTSIAIQKINSNNAHFLHRADWNLTAASITITAPNGHYFFSNNYNPADSGLAGRIYVKHNVVSGVASAEQTVIQVCNWPNFGYYGYTKEFYDPNQFYNYRMDTARGDLKTPSKTIQTTADMEGYTARDTWMCFAYQFGANDFNHWINGKEMPVLGAESGLGGSATPDELWLDCGGNLCVAEIWIYSVKHAKEDVQSVMQNLCNKYGIAYTNQPL